MRGWIIFVTQYRAIKHVGEHTYFIAPDVTLKIDRHYFRIPNNNIILLSGWKEAAPTGILSNSFSVCVGELTATASVKSLLFLSEWLLNLSDHLWTRVIVIFFYLLSVFVLKDCKFCVWSHTLLYWLHAVVLQQLSSSHCLFFDGHSLSFYYFFVNKLVGYGWLTLSVGSVLSSRASLFFP